MSGQTERRSKLPGHVLYAPWEQTFRRVLTPFEDFIQNQVTSGRLLLAATAIALLLANSRYGETFAAFFHSPIGLYLGPLRFEHSLLHWINDGLMALFFFVVGLEIKREVLVGELSQARAATLPILCAAGGMVAPAALYTLFNFGGDGAHGWGIPMATDIAFAVGVLVLLGKRVPPSLLTFLVALAIVDDLGAVLVIALFYTQQLDAGFLAAAGLLWLLLIGFNLGGVRRALPYFAVGLLLWLCMLESGVHATLAGILVALTVPVRPRYDTERFSARVRELLDRYDASPQAGPLLQSDEQRAILHALQSGIHRVESPLQRLEHSMHRPVAFLIVPLFALANAGVTLSAGDLGAAVRHPVTLGVILGLVLGKLIGIAGTALLAVRLGLGRLPSGCNSAHMIGVALIAGIGFTMSIFIAELGFQAHDELLRMAKTGVLLGSLIAGISGLLWLRLATRLPG